MEPFREDIMSSATYYEINNYVAEYVQELLEEVGGESFPVSIDNLLTKLEIKQEKSFPPHIGTGIGSVHDVEPSIAIVPYVDKNSNYGHWHLLKCIAKVIISGSKPQLERYINVPDKNESLANMLAYELMLPYKQAISYFITSNFFEQVSKRLLRKPVIIRRETEIGELIDIDYPVFQKTQAFYYLLEVCESMVALDRETVEMQRLREMIDGWIFKVPTNL